MSKKITYSAKDILSQLDKCAKKYTFPMLDNGYVYPVESRLTAYRDAERWAIVIEAVGFNYRGGGHNGISNCLHVYGNCLEYDPGTNNNNFLSITGNSKDGETFDEEYAVYLNPKVKTMMLRDKKVLINHDPKFYKAKNIKLEESPKIKVWEFLRSLLPEHRSDLLATEEELRNRIPQDIPEFIRLDEWNHPDLANGEKPSESETFKMLAAALEAGDINKFKLAQKSNNHWSNWPEGGTL